MKLGDALAGAGVIFLDTPILVYAVESHPTFGARARAILGLVSAGDLRGVTSPITLAECLVVPQREGNSRAIGEFTELITSAQNVHFALIGQRAAVQAAQLRARYPLRLPDALQLSVAIEAGCDAFLTNDARLKRVEEIRVLVLEELDP